MSRAVSIGAMVKQIGGLLGTKDISEWEENFIESIIRFSNNGDITVHLSEKQINRIESIFVKHFFA